MDSVLGCFFSSASVFSAPCAVHVRHDFLPLSATCVVFCITDDREAVWTIALGVCMGRPVVVGVLLQNGCRFGLNWCGLRLIVAKITCYQVGV